VRPRKCTVHRRCSRWKASSRSLDQHSTVDTWGVADWHSCRSDGVRSEMHPAGHNLQILPHHKPHLLLGKGRSCYRLFCGGCRTNCQLLPEGLKNFLNFHFNFNSSIFCGTRSFAEKLLCHLFDIRKKWTSWNVQDSLPKAQRTWGLSSSCQSHIASSNANLDQISSSESWLSIN